MTAGKARRILRRLAATLGIGALLVAIALGLSHGWLQTDSGRAWIAAFASGRISRPGELEVRFEGLSGDLLNDFRVRSIVIGDGKGTWLSLEDARIAWVPLGLLAQRLDIEALTVAALRLTRLPARPERAPSPGFTWPALPIAIAAKRLSVDELFLGADVVGEDVTLRAAGESRLTREGLAHSMRLQRIDGPTGQLDVGTNYAASERRLALSLSLDEAPGGIVSHLLGLDGLPAFSLDLDGDGPLDAWRARLTADAGADRLVEAELSVAMGEVVDARVVGRVEGAPYLDEPLATWLAGPMALDAEARVGPGYAVSLARVELAHAHATAALSGTVAEGALDLRAHLELAPFDWQPRAPAPAGLAVGGAELHAVVTGTVSRPAAVVDFSASAVRAAAVPASAEHLSARVEIEVDGPLPTAAPRVRAEGSVVGLATDLAQLDARVGKRIDWTFSGRAEPDTGALDIDAAELRSERVRVGARGRLQGWGETWALELSAAHDDLAALAGAVEGAPRGSATFAGHARRDAAEGPIVARGSLVFPGIDTGYPTVDRLLGAQPSADVAVTYRAGAPVAIELVSARTRAFVASADARVTPDTLGLEGAYRLELLDASALPLAADISIAPGATVAGTVRGSATDLRVDGNAHLPGSQVAGLALGSVAARFDVAGPGPTGPAPAMSGSIALDTQVPELGAARLSAGFALDAGGTLAVRDIRGAAGESTATGELRVPLAGGPVQGQIAVKARVLEAWSAVTGRSLAGSADIEATLSGRGARQDLSASFEGRAISVQSGSDARGALRLSTVTFDAAVRDVLGTPIGRANLTARDVVRADVRLEQIDLAVETTGAGDGAVTLALSGDAGKRFELEATGAVERRGPRIAVSVTGLAGELDGQRLALEPGARIEHGPDATVVRDVSLTLASGRVTLAGSTAGSGPKRSIEVELAAEALDLEALAVALPGQALSGVVSAAARLEGTVADPRGRFELALAGLRARPMMTESAPRIDAAARGEWRDGRVAIEGAVEAPFRVALQADLPLAIASGGRGLAIDPDAAIRGGIEWQGSLRPLWEVVDTGELTLAGEGDLALRLAGTLAAPRVAGHLTVGEARMENASTGGVLESIAIRITGDQAGLVLEEASATDGDRGRVRASGGVSLDPASGFPVDVSLELEDARLVSLDDVNARASGLLRLHGNAKSLILDGVLTTRRIDVTLGGASGARRPVELDVVELNAPPTRARTAARAPSRSSGLVRLALDIEMPGQVFVRGLGLESEWAGKLEVRGHSDAPSIAGAIRPVRGRYSLAGRTFVLKQGSVRFPGTGEVDPILNLPAEFEGAGFTAVVTVAGRASQPQITLSSRPTMPQSEIMARVLFGQGSASLSTQQALQLASAAATLTGEGGGWMERARRTIGVDTIQIGEREESDPTLGVGRYVSERVFVEAEVGTRPDAAGAAVEVEVLPGLRIGGAVDARLDSRARIRWRWDF